MFNELLTCFSLKRLDNFWCQTIERSIVLQNLSRLFQYISLGYKNAVLAHLLQKISYLLVLILFVILALPQFANDKEILALIPLASLVFWLTGNILGGKERREANAVDILVLVYAAVSLIAATSSHYLLPSLKGLAKVFVYIASYFLFSMQLASHPKRKLWLVCALVIAATLASIYGIYQYKVGVEPLATWEDPNVENKITRVYATFNNPNLFAGYLVPAMPFALSLAIAALANGNYLLSVLPVAAALLITIATLLTGSRGGYLGLLGSIVAFFIIGGSFVWRRYPRAKGTLLLIFLFLPLISLFVLHFFPGFEQRIISIFAGREHSSNSYRMNVWLSSLAMFKDNWWLGVGIGNQAFRLAYGLYMRSGFDALGTYCVPLEVAVETGIIGLLFFMLIIIAALARGHLGFSLALANWQRWLTAGAAAAIIGLMAHGLVDTVFYRPQVQLIFWLALAILVTAENVTPEKVQEP